VGLSEFEGGAGECRKLLIRRKGELFTSALVDRGDYDGEQKKNGQGRPGVRDVPFFMGGRHRSKKTPRTGELGRRSGASVGMEWDKRFYPVLSSKFKDGARMGWGRPSRGIRTDWGRMFIGPLGEK